jgi:uncharacterized protein YkwD
MAGGENIWAGSSHVAVSPVALARHILDAWLSSPGHRGNILNPEDTHVGLGIAAKGREIRAKQLLVTLERLQSLKKFPSDLVR